MADLLMIARPLNDGFSKMIASKASPIDRRHFLRGLGISLAIPAFDSLNSGFAAHPLPRNPKRLVCVGNHLGFWPDGFFPKTAGEDYEMSLTLRGIEKHRQDFTVFSNLDHGISGGHAAVHNFLSGVNDLIRLVALSEPFRKN